jgi:hypothetical protein
VHRRLETLCTLTVCGCLQLCCTRRGVYIAHGPWHSSRHSQGVQGEAGSTGKSAGAYSRVWVHQVSLIAQHVSLLCCATPRYVACYAAVGPCVRLYARALLLVRSESNADQPGAPCCPSSCSTGTAAGGSYRGSGRGPTAVVAGFSICWRLPCRGAEAALCGVLCSRPPK